MHIVFEKRRHIILNVVFKQREQHFTIVSLKFIIFYEEKKTVMYRKN